MARVLVVDDEPLIRQLLRTYLERAGHVVMEAGDGRDALAVFAKDRPDLVVTDNAMPKLTGAAMVRELRKEAPETKVLVMSGFPEETTLLDVHRLLPKPFTREAFIEAVEEILRT